MKPLLTAEWTNLAVATFETEKALLKKYLPYKTELSDYNGHYYMSLVGFLFSKPVIAGIPSPFYRCFEELNLRFYVRYREKSNWVNAVVFIREIAPSPLIGLAARFLYRENFTSLPMQHSFSKNATEQETAYYWKINRQWDYMKLSSTLFPVEPKPSSPEFFIREHYRACTHNGAQRTKEFRIEHPHWNIYPGLSFDLRINAEKLYGKDFEGCFSRPPSFFFLMDGSGTTISYPSLV